MIRNSYLPLVTSITVSPEHGGSIPAASEQEAGIAFVTDAHLAALLALPEADLRRVRLGSFEVTDLGEPTATGALTAAAQALVASARVSTYRTPMAQRVA